MFNKTDVNSKQQPMHEQNFKCDTLKSSIAYKTDSCCKDRLSKQ